MQQLGPADFERDVPRRAGAGRGLLIVAFAPLALLVRATTFMVCAIATAASGHRVDVGNLFTAISLELLELSR